MDAPLVQRADEDEGDLKNVQAKHCRPVTAADVWTSSKHIGIPLNFMCLAIMDSAYGNLIYPVCNNLLGLPQNYINQVGGLGGFFMGFKIFFAFITDSVPILGLRRKYYILIGWTMVALLFILNGLYVYKHEDTRYCYNSGVKISMLAKVDALNATGCPDGTDFDVVTIGDKFDANLGIAWFSFAAGFFFVMADVAADSYSVQLAQREPEGKRGQIQTYNYNLRYFCDILFGFTGNIFYDSPPFGGTSTFQLPLSFMFFGFAAIIGCCIPFWMLFEEETSTLEAKPYFRKQFGTLWDLMKNHGYGALCLFELTGLTLFYLSSTGGTGLMNSWITPAVTPLFLSIAGSISTGIVLVTLYIVGTWGRSWDWRILNATAMIFTPLTSLTSLIIVYNINRSRAFWLFCSLDSTVFAWLNWIAMVWGVNEMAPRGLEGSTMALGMTFHNTGITLSSALSNLIGGYTAPLIQDDKYDDPDAPSQMAFNIYVVTALNLLGVILIPLYPSQKENARHRFQNWGKSRLAAVSLLVILLASFVFGNAATFVSIFCPCSHFGGGSGCVPGTCRSPSK